MKRLDPRLRLALLGALSLIAYLAFFLSPFPLVGAIHRWHQTVGTLTGFDLGKMFIFVAGLALLFGLYALGLRWSRSLDSRCRLSWSIILLGALGFCLVLLLTYPFYSTDIFDNIMHGRILGVYGANPFHHPPAEFADDPFFKYAVWQDDTSAYGPWWEGPAALLSQLAGDGLVANVLLFKGVSILAYAADAALIALILRRIAPARTLQGVYLFAWNPLVLMVAALDGHNDLVMMTFVLAGVYLATRERWLSATLVQVAGALVKFIPLALAPLLMAAELRPGRDRRWTPAAMAAGLAMLLVVVSYLPFWEGVEVLGVGRRRALLTSSAPTIAYLVLRDWLGGAAGGRVVSGWALAGFAYLVTSQAWALWRHSVPVGPSTGELSQDGGASPATAEHPTARLIRSLTVVLLGYLLAFCLWFWPWYLVWIVPLAAMLPRGVLRNGILLFTFTAVWKPLVLPYWRTVFGLPAYEWRQIILVVFTMLAPWFYFGYHRVRGVTRRLKDPGAPA